MSCTINIKTQIPFYISLFLLVFYFITWCCNNDIKDMIHYFEWNLSVAAILFVLLTISSAIVRSEGVKSGRRAIYGEGIFWLGWILCFGGMLFANSINEAAEIYLLWACLSLSTIPIIWCMWASYPGGLKDLSLILAKAMVVGSFIHVFLNYVLTPFLVRMPLAPQFEFIGITSHPNTNGIMCGGFAVAAAFLIAAEKKHRLVYVLSFALSLSGIIASNCRSAELGLILAVLCGGIYCFRHKWLSAIRRRGLPPGREIAKATIYILLAVAVCIASVAFLRGIDKIHVVIEPDKSVAIVEDSILDQEEAHPDVVKRLAVSNTNDPDPHEMDPSHNGYLYERINTLSSDRLILWDTYVRKITPLGNGKIKGLMIKTKSASYSAHNNWIEVLYISGYVAGAGYIIWILCCLCFIGWSMFGRGPFRIQTLFFMVSFLMFLTISMLDVIQYPFIRGVAVMTYLSLGIVAFRRKKAGRVYRIVKRLLDIMVGIIGCAVLPPVMILVKIGQMATGDRGSLFYRQTRVGYRGRHFTIYKFRTMDPEADRMLDELLKDQTFSDQWVARQKLDNDPRVTKIGRLLRKTSIDELPQLLNVLKGDMSLVGPRPLVPGELEEHGGTPLYNKVRPGMTGWWICHGHSGTTYRKRLELEYCYVRNCSPGLDMICVIKTLLRQTGAEDGDKSIEEKEKDILTIDEADSPTISVIIPTLNAEANLPVLLTSLHNQRPKAREIIVVDSASTDETKSICEKDPDVRLIEIPREEFDHGGTRDMAVRHTSTDVVVFLSQDATPVGRDFLRRLTAPLEEDDVAVSTGRQIPRHDAPEAEKLIRAYNYPDMSFTRTKDDLDKLGIKTYFVSNVCAAYRRDIYDELGGFEAGLKTNEDMFYAAKAINSGYKIAYVEDARVYHSHDMSWREQYRRNRIQGYEISRHKDVLGDVSLESEGIKMVANVALKLIGRCRFIAFAGFACDCCARYLGSHRGRREGRLR